MRLHQRKGATTPAAPVVKATVSQSASPPHSVVSESPIPRSASILKNNSHAMTNQLINNNDLPQFMQNSVQLSPFNYPKTPAKIPSIASISGYQHHPGSVPQQSPYAYPPPSSSHVSPFPTSNLATSHYEYPRNNASFSSPQQQQSQHQQLASDTSSQRKRPMRQRRASSAPAPDMSLILAAAGFITDEGQQHSAADLQAAPVEHVEEAAKRRKMSVLEALRMLSEPNPTQQPYVQPQPTTFFDDSYLNLASVASTSAVSPAVTGHGTVGGESLGHDQPNVTGFSKVADGFSTIEENKGSLAIMTDALFMPPGAPASARAPDGPGNQMALSVMVGGRKMSLSNLVSRRESIYGLNPAMFVSNPIVERVGAAISAVKEECGSGIENVSMAPVEAGTDDVTVAGMKL
ncbi:hypothetical protein HDU81_000583 [Chytriomyces hyalinus]|nr:hypothetical protein HDU81_003680 [Chytriomyces hyalinus]KAJ3235376.1 hypothetical protein HDU81_000583 [Chytriomyces hyalinus]